MTNIECIHCGEDCGKNPVIWLDKPFCCNGCKTVYQLLNENKLYSYYEIDNTPGIKIANTDLSSKFQYLDEEEIQNKLIDFKEGNIVKITFYIPSIHCSSCIWLLENLNKLNKGIIRSMVNFIKKEVAITFNCEQISLRQIAELLASIHYIPLITKDKAEKKNTNSQDKKLLYRIGVAAVAFGNTMLFSFPEYFGSHEPNKYLFGYLNLLFGIPVFFFSGSDYLISAYKNIRKKIINIDLPVSLGIVAIFAQSTYEILTRSGAGYMDSLTGFIFFLLIGKWYQNKSYQALSFERDYKSYFPVAVTVINESGEKNILLEKLKPNDKILVRNMELIPADSILIKGEAYIDYSFVTGESRPIKKQVGEELYAGGRQTGEALELKIIKEVEQSKLTKLWNQNEKPETNNLKQNIDIISKYFTITVILIATITGFFWFFNDSSIALKAFTSVLIVACPCALALSAPFAFGSAMGFLGRQNFYLKKPDVLEKLAKIDTIVFDKTGTITQTNSVKIEFNGEKLTDIEFSIIKTITRQSTHPMSSAINDFLKNYEILTVSDFREIAARGVVGNINGIKVKIGSEEFVSNNKSIVSVKSSCVFVSFDDKIKGYFKIENKYREGLESLISELDKKYQLHLVSGDNDAEKTYLKTLFKAENSLHFNQSPIDKLEYIKKLKSEGKIVLMVGDGLNDAGALNSAHAGISIADDIYHFSPGCDAILEAKSFNNLIKYLKFSKTTKRIIKTSFFISIIYNLVGLSFAIRGLLSPIIAAILMPASSVTVVAFVTVAVYIKAHFAGIKSK